ncbi:RagB/SusD family nutrient uptake outer membrane protein [Ilyomonas limi]|uniref:RagB/SusD family nutrient uptake outer membrane protein n=1 Tax=Ilyomonas limi TaxID=2575867 RepID=A0A4U3KSI7_9BACT|nr:RagB/SusD family nutrient uptake outer membrane protein [Ilyomonas limi]TKK64424.1 RagB/SusD family nutrient uptake outer membrane protein [Ilyomonas limi]
MNNKIKISWGVLLAMPLLMTFSGCQKFLDRKPLDATLEDIPGGGLEGQALGLYSEIRGVHYDGFNTIPWLAFHSFRDDDSQKGSSPGDGSDWGAIFDDFNYTKNHWSNDQYWADHYAFLGNINKMIQIGDSLKQTDERAVINMGEAKFFRAYVYFDLVRVYGQVPLVTFRANTSEQANVPKSSEADIYAQIDKDLDSATAALPVSWEGKYPGRLTQGAALTLHAKTYLYRQRWADALALCTQVMNSGQYSLYSSYEGLFRESGENSSESIFEIQATETAGNSSGALYNYAGSQGTRGSGDWNLGWGWNAPTDELANHTYEPGDPRREATILFSGQPDGLYGNVLPPYDPNNFPQPYWNKKVYTDPSIRLSTGDQSGAWFNHRILRYADVILMAAEASNELGDTAKARELINQIRARARGTTNALPDIEAAVSQDNMRKLIIQERHAEFAMEGERFFDLVRWGIADSVLAPLGYTHKNRYYPLPQGQVDASHGVLVQNPDYQ